MKPKTHESEADAALEAAARVCDTAGDEDTNDDQSFAAAMQARELAQQIRALKGGKWR